MKKYLLLSSICLSLIETNVFAAFYSADLNEGHRRAEENCASARPGTRFPNMNDSSYFAECNKGALHLTAKAVRCGGTTTVGIGLKLPYLFNVRTSLCEGSSSIAEFKEKIKSPNGVFVGYCYYSNECNCRDNPDPRRLTGTCKCNEVYGTHRDYSTCKEQAPCAPITDINGVDRAEYSVETESCQAPAGYTYADPSGNYEFSASCTYSK